MKNMEDYYNVRYDGFSLLVCPCNSVWSTTLSPDPCPYHSDPIDYKVTHYNMGWSCPKCDRTYSPAIEECKACNEKIE